MSLRAIKKRENQLNSSAGVRQPLFKKASTQHQQRKSSITSGSNSDNNSKVNTAIFKQPGGLHTLSNLQNQYTLLGRAIYSSPELRHPLTVDDDTVESLAHVVRTKSEGDLHALLKSCTGNAADTTGCGLIGAKSEVCLQSISSHSYQEESQTTQTSISNYTTESTINNLRTPVSEPIGSPQNTGKTFNRSMMSGARSHRDLTQSTYTGNSGTYDVTLSPTRRRMSECSLNSIAGYSQRTSAMYSSVLTLSSNNPAANEPNSVMRVPIIGYEVMEERARFTVYKLRVENPLTNDCWLVLRRYTDFVRLNTKLKQLFPNIVLLLPRKKIFGDNFNAVFLDNRVQGLQIFVNSIMAKEELRKCKLVREFFCLDEPPSYSESMEECRAIFEAQEETIAHLKVQVNSKNELILNLQQKLRDEIVEKEQLKLTLKNTSNTCPQCTATNSSAP
ncbi:sorting nexin-16 [Anastrepha ludens]|uniref:sorting nexin-16 n=1 Tax=Anastrepha ludens TaxID=28586 RepID=UPI0023B01D83|nr:sorting nexin-16 [Anastrepha ludens]XP_053966270.1 sorting nexin-16 [Anastrepha ludens]